MKNTKKDTLGKRDYLLNMSFGSAMELAVGRSPMSREDVAFRMGWTPSFAGRIFNVGENYWPAVTSIPQLCAVLGNTDLIEWLYVQATAMLQGNFESPPDLESAEGLLLHVTGIGAELGDVLHAVEAAVVGDGIVQPHEAKTIIKEARDVLERLDTLVGAMNHIREDGREE